MTGMVLVDSGTQLCCSPASSEDSCPPQPGRSCIEYIPNIFLMALAILGFHSHFVEGGQYINGSGWAVQAMEGA